MDELAPVVAADLSAAGAHAPQERRGVLERSLKVGLGFHAQEVAEVEHHTNIVALSFACNADRVAEAVDEKTGVRVEHNFHAVRLGLVGNLLHESDGLLVGVGALVALHKQLEISVAALEVGQGGENGGIVSVPLSSKPAADVKAVELEAGFIVGLEAGGQGEIGTEIGRANAVVAQLLEHGDPLLDLAEVYAVLKRKHRPRLVGGLNGASQQERK